MTCVMRATRLPPRQARAWCPCLTVLVNGILRQCRQRASLSRDARAAGVRALGRACRVSPAGQLVSRREEALLQAGLRMFPRARLTGGVIVAFRLFCRPGCGVGDQSVPGRRRSWRGAGQVSCSAFSGQAICG